MLILSVPPVRVIAVSTVKVWVELMTRRVLGLTPETLAIENLSPTLKVCPLVPVTARTLPDWFAPVTVTPPVAAVPTVCFHSEFDRYHSHPAAVPITPVRYMREISGAGLNCVTLG